MDKVLREQAEQEVNSWLDYKKVSSRKRENLRDSIDALIDYIVDGTLVLNEDKSFTQNLRVPLDGEASLTQLSFKARLKFGTLQAHMQGVKATDLDSRLCAYIAALTAKPKELIKALDLEDTSIAQQIVIFFL